jgi:hypothetical protein
VNGLAEAARADFAVSKRTISQRLFGFCYVIAITVATLGWLSAFGWLTVRVTKWLLT